VLAVWLIRPRKLWTEPWTTPVDTIGLNLRSRRRCQELELGKLWGRSGAFAHENAQTGGVGGKVLDHVRDRAALEGVGEMIERAIEHLLREGGHGLLEACGHGVSEIHQNGLENPGGPELHAHTVLRAGPEVGQAEQALDRVKSILQAPALPVQDDGIEHRQTRRVPLIG